MIFNLIIRDCLEKLKLAKGILPTNPDGKTTFS